MFGQNDVSPITARAACGTFMRQAVQSPEDEDSCSLHFNVKTLGFSSQARQLHPRAGETIDALVGRFPDT